LIDYTRRAVEHLSALFDHYEAKERPEAMRNLMEAMRDAWAEIERDPQGGLAAPRPYPELARPGTLWRHSRSYWVAYCRAPRLAITAIFYDESDIPGRS